MHLRQEAELHARSDQQLLRVRAAAAVFELADECELRLDADGDLGITRGVAPTRRPLERSLFRVAGVLLPDEVAAPVPARHDVPAEQQFQLAGVGSALLFPFCVER